MSFLSLRQQDDVRYFGAGELGALGISVEGRRVIADHNEEGRAAKLSEGEIAD